MSNIAVDRVQGMDNGILQKTRGILERKVEKRGFGIIKVI